MKQYTDTDRFDVLTNGNTRLVSRRTDTGGFEYMLMGICDPCSDWHSTERAAIDDAMNREAGRTTNEQLKDMTGGNAG